MLILIAIKGPDRGTVFELAPEQRHLIGRQSQTIRMRDRKLSRRHADIYFDGGAWFINDTASTNGTRVNSKRIEEPTPLDDGDRIQLGRTVFVVGRLHDGAQPMHATLAPELDAAMQLHDSEHDLRLQEDSSDEFDQLMESEHSARSRCPSGSSQASSSSVSVAAREPKAHRSQPGGASEPLRRSRSSPARSQAAQAAAPPATSTVGPVSQSPSRGFWWLAAGVLLLIGLQVYQSLREPQPTAPPAVALTPEQRALHEQLLAQFTRTEDQVEQIAGLIETQGEQQNRSFDQLQLALASLPAPVDRKIVDEMLAELRSLPQATGDAWTRQVLAAIEGPAQRQQALLDEVRVLLESQPKPAGDEMMAEVLTELRTRPVDAGSAAAKQVIDALQMSAQNQTRELLAALAAQPKPAGEDLVKEVLAQVRAQPKPDSAALAREFAAAVQTQTSQQTADLIAEMRAAINDQPQRANDETVRQLIAELREQPKMSEFIEQVVAAVQHEARLHNDTLLQEMRTALAAPRAADRQLADQVIAELREQPQLDGDALREQIVAAMQTHTQGQSKLMLDQLRAAIPALDTEALTAQIAAAVKAQDHPGIDPSQLTRQIVAALQTHSSAENAALLSQMQTAFAAQPRPADEALVQLVLKELRDKPAPDFDKLAQELAASVNTQMQQQNDALLQQLRTTLDAQPQPASAQLVQQALAGVQAQVQEHNQAMLAEVRGQLQLENQALLEELLASLQSGEGKLADAGGSRLLSHMRPLSRPGPVTLDQQRAEQQRNMASGQLGPMNAEPPRSAALVAAAANLFEPKESDAGAPAGPAPGPALGAEVRTASGLRYVVNKAGHGLTANTGDTVLVHYTGYLADGTTFDSTRERNKPFGFELGKGSVIQGWEEGVRGMAQGERRTLHVPAELAYGSRGAGRNIPPNAPLTFDMEVITILKAPGAQN